MGWFTDIGALGHAPFPLFLGPTNINTGIFGMAAGSSAAPIAYGGGVLILANGTALEGIEASGPIKATSAVDQPPPGIPSNTSTTFYVEQSRPDANTVFYWAINRNQTVDQLKSSNQELSISIASNGKPTINEVIASTFGQLIDWTHKMGFHGSNQSDNVTFNDLGAFIHGWRGSDTLTGGAGEDHFWEGSSASDRNIIDGRDGIDGVNYSFVWEQKTNDVGVVINGGFDGGQTGETIINVEHLTATEKDDSIFVPTGNAPDTHIDTHTSGDAGDDKIRGNGQRNEIFGGTGSDKLYGGDGNDVIFGNIQFHTAGGEHDEIDGGDGNDWLYADLEGSAWIKGGDGDDVIWGGDGSDVLEGGKGHDYIRGYSETSSPTTNPDILEGGEGNDTVVGANGNDAITGGTGADQLSGGGGEDHIDARNEPGDTASDTVDGGAGNDVMLVDIGDKIVNVENGDIIGLFISNSTSNLIVGFNGTSTVFYQYESWGNDQAAIEITNGVGATAFSFSTTSGTMYATVQSSAASNSQGFATSSLDPAKSKQDTQSLLAEVGLDVAKGVLSDYYDHLWDKVGDEVEEYLLTRVGQIFNKAPTWIVKDVAKKWAPAIQFAEFGGAMAALTVSYVTGEFKGTAGDMAELVGQAVNEAFSPAPATTEALFRGALKLGGAVMEDFLQQVMTAYGDELQKAAEDLESNTGTSGDDSIDNGHSHDGNIYVPGDGDDSIKDGDGDSSILNGSQVGPGPLRGAERAASSHDGNDTFNGGGGSDTLVLSSLTSKANVDLSKGRASGKEIGTDKLTKIENVVGGSAGDMVVGNSARNALEGMGGADTLSGLGGNDTVVGGKGSDSLSGGGGRDTLAGGVGKDRLAGGDKADTFMFDTKLGAKHADTITDFKHNTDIIALDDTIFAAIGPTLDAGEFFAKRGAVKAHDADDRIVYNKSNGRLYYDDDGKGGHAAVHFATLSTKPTLDHGDFAIV